MDRLRLVKGDDLYDDVLVAYIRIKNKPRFFDACGHRWKAIKSNKDFIFIEVPQPGLSTMYGSTSVGG